MKLTAQGRCRGDGKLYTLIAFDIAGIESVSAWSSVGDLEVPAHVVRLGEGRYVLALADFTSSQCVKLIVKDLSGNQHEASLTVNPRLYSIVSKLNGVMNKELLAEVRNIDSSGIRRDVTFTCDGLIPTETGLIVRGFVSEPQDVRIKDIVAFDQRGSMVARSDVFLNEFGSRGDVGGSLSALVYSIEIPLGLEGLCLAARDFDDNFIGAFVSYKSKQYKDLVDASYERLSDAAVDWRYPKWIAERRLTAAAAREQRGIVFPHAPKFSVIVPLYKTPIGFFRDMADSVIRQTYQNWELILVNSTPDEDELKKVVEEYAASDSRLRVIELESNLGITENTNAGIEVATGDFLCFFDHDDVLEPDILFEYARAIESDDKIDLLYCDEDKLFPDGSFGMPTFKPDFSLDMVRDNNYICHLLTVRTSAYRQIEPSGPELDGAQDHAMVLKISELGGHIHHVSKVLYHWRISETSTAGNSDSKPYATEAGIRAVQQHLDRVGLFAKVSNSHGRAFRYRVDYLQSDQALVSIVVPTRGDVAVLSGFIDSLCGLKYDSWELVLVCSGETVERVTAIVNKTSAADRVKVVVANTAFTPASWLNVGSRATGGECMIFMHDDATFVEMDSLSVLAGFAMREDVGIVGTMSCAVDGVIQQAGLAVLGERVIPLSAGTHRSVPGYLYFPLTVRNVTAVDGACFAMSRGSLEMLGGFDEGYEVDYPSVDLSFAAAKEGMKVVYTPEAWVLHRSVSDYLLEGDYGRRAQRSCDTARLLTKWRDVFAKNDAYLNRSFSRSAAKASLYQIDYDGALSFGLNR